MAMNSHTRCHTLAVFNCSAVCFQSFNRRLTRVSKSFANPALACIGVIVKWVWPPWWVISPIPASSNGRAVMASRLAGMCQAHEYTPGAGLGPPVVHQGHRRCTELTTLQILSREPGPAPLILDLAGWPRAIEGVFGIAAIPVQLRNHVHLVAQVRHQHRIFVALDRTLLFYKGELQLLFVLTQQRLPIKGRRSTTMRRVRRLA